MGLPFLFLDFALLRAVVARESLGSHFSMWTYAELLRMAIV